MKYNLPKINFSRLPRPSNLKVVVLCLATAATFWLFNALNKSYDTSLRYPVEWAYDVETYIVVDELPDRIQMNVRGLGWNLVRASLGLKVNPLNIQLAAPVAQKKIPGLSLTNDVAEELENLVLNYIIDDTLYLNIDQRGTRSFAVYVDSTNISLADNYRITSPINYNVDLVEIAGPLSMLQAIPSDSFLVEIRADQIDEDFNEEVVFTIDRQDLFSFRPAAMQVSFSVAEFVADQITVPVTMVDFPDDSKFFLADTTATLIYSVQENQESLIVADSFAIAANYNMFNPADSTLLLSILKYPANVYDVRLEYPQVRVTYNE